MLKFLKRAGLLVLVLALVGGSLAYRHVKELGAIASGMVSHTVCMNVFVAKRDIDEVSARDLSAIQRRVTESQIEDNTIVTQFKLGPVRNAATSLYRPGLGCTILAGETLEDVAAIQMKPVLDSTKGADVSWPEVSRDHAGVDYLALDAVVDAAFTEDSADVDDMKSTRAVLVYYDGSLIAERYADGFNGDTPQRGMSMTKSVTSALVGVLVDQGKLNVDNATGLEYWQGKSDPRREITLEQMLKMTAGFDYNEQLEDKPRSLINYVFFNSADMSKRASEVGLRAVPGETWDYQTVHPILLQKIIRDAIGDDQAYFRFAQEELFARAGMTNSHLSADASGTFTGGALMWASARDWMRFGLLYLNDGLYNEARVLPEGWVQYSSMPSKASLNGTAYGAQFWLNRPAKEQLMPGLPEDAYAAMGHYGQYVMIVPSKDLVVVRLGMTFPPKMFDRAALLRDVLDTLDE